ncbi:MAG: IS481 family transposase [Gemmatimonadales bacterium]|jgi:transposase InsO family protein
MPWSATQVIDERISFAIACERGVWSVGQVSTAFGVSRKTGYKWLDRYRRFGKAGLEDRSRAPRRHPNAVSEDVVALILEFRHKHPRWGPKKLKGLLEGSHPGVSIPAASTIGEVLRRAGASHPRRRRRAVKDTQAGACRAVKAANDVWTADYKGWIRNGDGTRCEPLTIADSYSRYLLACRGLEGIGYRGARREFERAFREYGLPRAIRTDNGAPFSYPHAIAGLSALNVWWIQLGIEPERTRPGKPQDNASHERMHRTLKADTMRRPRSNMKAQQRAFDRFRREFNELRPHEALGQKPPATCYTPSPRPYPSRLPEPQYPLHFEVRRVKRDGRIKWRGEIYFISEVLRRLPVGLERMDDDCWRLHFGHLAIGELNDRCGEVLKYRVLRTRA